MMLIESLLAMEREGACAMLEGVRIGRFATALALTCRLKEVTLNGLFSFWRTHLSVPLQPVVASAESGVISVWQSDV